MKHALLLLSLLTIPSRTYAANGGLQAFLKNLGEFINTVVIPFLLGVAFLLFAINAIRYFIFEGATEDGREKAKSLALYSVLAFFVIIIFWGMVNLLATSTGLEGKGAPTPDYLALHDKETGGAANTPSDTDTNTANENSSCGTLETTFDNIFGGPCANNGVSEEPADAGMCPPGETYSESASSCVDDSASAGGGTSGGGYSGSSYWSSNDNYNYDNNDNDNGRAPRRPRINGTQGSTSYGVVGTDITFTLLSSDPDDDNIYYQIAWSDYPEQPPTDQNVILNYPTESSTLPSNTPITVTRHWSVAGTYTFRTRAVDTNDNQSGWTTHTVIISPGSAEPSNGTQSFDPATGYLIP